jgi:hypothetical protein
LGSSYWTSLISATVEDAAPNNIVLTFPLAFTTTAADWSVLVNGANRAVSSLAWVGGVLKLTLASGVIYGDVVTISMKGLTEKPVINNILYKMLLNSINLGTGVSTLRMEVSANITVTLDGSARFYTDSGGTQNESTTWSLTAGALRTIYLKCTNGIANMTFSDASKLIKFGSDVDGGWVSINNAPKIIFTTTRLNLTQLRLTGRSEIIGVLPTGLTYFALAGTEIIWTYNDALPNGLTFLYISGLLINWTGLNIGNNGNISEFSLLNYRVTKMSSANIITLLTQMTNRTGTLPATVTINDYADYASPPAEVVTAVNTLKAAKSITTVTLGA